MKWLSTPQRICHCHHELFSQSANTAVRKQLRQLLRRQNGNHLTLACSIRKRLPSSQTMSLPQFRIKSMQEIISRLWNRPGARELTVQVCPLRNSTVLQELDHVWSNQNSSPEKKKSSKTMRRYPWCSMKRPLSRSCGACSPRRMYLLGVVLSWLFIIQSNGVTKRVQYWQSFFKYMQGSSISFIFVYYFAYRRLPTVLCKEPGYWRRWCDYECMKIQFRSWTRSISREKTMFGQSLGPTHSTHT